MHPDHHREPSATVCHRPPRQDLCCPPPSPPSRLKSTASSPWAASSRHRRPPPRRPSLSTKPARNATAEMHMRQEGARTPMCDRLRPAQRSDSADRLPTAANAGPPAAGHNLYTKLDVVNAPDRIRMAADHAYRQNGLHLLPRSPVPVERSCRRFGLKSAPRHVPTHARRWVPHSPPPHAFCRVLADDCIVWADSLARRDGFSHTRTALSLFRDAGLCLRI